MRNETCAIFYVFLVLVGEGGGGVVVNERFLFSFKLGAALCGNSPVSVRLDVN